MVCILRSRGLVKQKRSRLFELERVPAKERAAHVSDRHEVSVSDAKRPFLPSREDTAWKCRAGFCFDPAGLVKKSSDRQRFGVVAGYAVSR